MIFFNSRLLINALEELISPFCKLRTECVFAFFSSIRAGGANRMFSFCLYHLFVLLSIFHFTARTTIRQTAQTCTQPDWLNTRFGPVLFWCVSVFVYRLCFVVSFRHAHAQHCPMQYRVRKLERDNGAKGSSRLSWSDVRMTFLQCSNFICSFSRSSVLMTFALYMHRSSAIEMIVSYVMCCVSVTRGRSTLALAPTNSHLCFFFVASTTGSFWPFPHPILWMQQILNRSRLARARAL